MIVSREWRIPTQVWVVLFSWGMALLVLAGVFAYWTWSNDIDQDREMCRLTKALISSEEPTGSSPGEVRSRDNRAAIREWRTSVRCSRFD